jgi:two-component system, oxyanion-binding sensor
MTGNAVFRIGLMRLTDAAPLIVARELGFFAAEDIDVSLSIEPSWANIADKLAYGLLDGAMLLPPLALALRLGLSGSAGPETIIVPAALSLNGNTVTLANNWAEPVLRGDAAAPAVETARRFRAVAAARGRKPLLAVVHTFSTHNLLLRYWLAAGGIDPDRDVAFIVVPPAEAPEALAAGTIDGFCAGAPWGRGRRARRHWTYGRDFARDLEQRCGKGLGRSRADCRCAA